MGDVDQESQLVAAARAAVRRAREGDRDAALLVLSNAQAALSSMMVFEEPDPNKPRQQVFDLNDERRLAFFEAPGAEQLVYLQSLMVSISSVLGGAEPEAALHIKGPPNRRGNRALQIRDVALFVAVGKEYDRLKEMGGVDDAMVRAKAAVAKQFGCSVATVEKAWTNHGSGDGWIEAKPDWK